MFKTKRRRFTKVVTNHDWSCGTLSSRILSVCAYTCNVFSSLKRIHRCLICSCLNISKPVAIKVGGTLFFSSSRPNRGQNCSITPHTEKAPIIILSSNEERRCLFQTWEEENWPWVAISELSLNFLLLPLADNYLFDFLEATNCFIKFPPLHLVQVNQELFLAYHDRFDPILPLAYFFGKVNNISGK